MLEVLQRWRQREPPFDLLLTGQLATHRILRDAVGCDDIQRVNGIREQRIRGRNRLTWCLAMVRLTRYSKEKSSNEQMRIFLPDDSLKVSTAFLITFSEGPVQKYQTA